MLQQTLYTSIYRYLASEDKTEKFAYVPFGAGKVLGTARVTFITCTNYSCTLLRMIATLAKQCHFWDMSVKQSVHCSVN